MPRCRRGRPRGRPLESSPRVRRRLRRRDERAAHLDAAGAGPVRRPPFHEGARPRRRVGIAPARRPRFRARRRSPCGARLLAESVVARDRARRRRARLARARLKELGHASDSVAIERELRAWHAVVDEARARVADAAAAEKARAPGTARQKAREALAILEALPHPASDGIAASLRWDVGFFSDRLGDLQAARDAWQSVRDFEERVLLQDHPSLQRTRMNFAATLAESGDLHGARALLESVLVVQERTLPPDHPNLQRTRQNLAATMHKLGDLRAARALSEKVLEVRE